MAGLATAGPARANDGRPDAIEALEVVPELTQVGAAPNTALTDSALGFQALGASGSTTTIERLDADSIDVNYNESGQTVIEGTSTDTDTIVQQLPDGGRVIEVISSPDAPQEFDYDVDVPAGMEILPQEDGSLLIGTQTQVGDEVTFEVDGVIGAAWAVDATGAAVPASYELGDDGVITMRVDHSADFDYPVVADPAYSLGGFQASWSIWQPHLVTVLLNKARSADAADGGAVVCAGVAVVPVVGTAIGIICGVHNVAIRAAARYGWCQRWDFSLWSRTMSVGVYRGGFCS